MIRKADIGDCHAICEICNEDLGYECKDELVKMRIERLDEKREAVFVAVDDGAVAGYIHVEKYNTLYFTDMANIPGLAVAGKYQRRGRGRKLTEAAERWAKENGIDRIRLNSGIGRTGAHKFYRAAGFGEEKEQIRFIKRL